jgi:hypothetical protein
MSVPVVRPVVAGKWEMVRRLRYGALLKLFRHRYGHQFPDDDAGRDDLFVLLCVVSLAPSASDKKVAHTISLWAPWMLPWEAAEYVEHINRLTLFDRMPAAKILGERLNLTNAERERLKLWPIKPVDMSVEQLIEQRKTKDKERKKARRRALGAKPRATSAKLWEAEGIPRSTWYRRRSGTRTYAVKTRTSATIVPKQRTKESHDPRGQQDNESSRPTKQTKTREAERPKQPSSPYLRTFESHSDVATLESNIDPEMAARIAALGDWGANASQKNSAVSPKKVWTKPTIGEMDLKECKIAWAERWRGRIHPALLEGAMAVVLH